MCCLSRILLVVSAHKIKRKWRCFQLFQAYLFVQGHICADHVSDKWGWWNTQRYGSKIRITWQTPKIFFKISHDLGHSNSIIFPCCDKNKSLQIIFSINVISFGVFSELYKPLVYLTHLLNPRTRMTDAMISAIARSFTAGVVGYQQGLFVCWLVA